MKKNTKWEERTELHLLHIGKRGRTRKQIRKEKETDKRGARERGRRVTRLRNISQGIVAIKRAGTVVTTASSRRRGQINDAGPANGGCGCGLVRAPGLGANVARRGSSWPARNSTLSPLLQPRKLKETARQRRGRPGRRGNGKSIHGAKWTPP